MAESFSSNGVPVFLADIKGDLAGMCICGEDTDDMKKRGFTSVPVLSVNGQLLNFYDANKWINEARTR